MKRINIIVEGQTERKFIEELLNPYFHTINSEIFLFAIPVETSIGHKGGDLKFSRYKKRVIELLTEQDKPIVSSLIDFYKLRNDFPQYENSEKIADKYEKIHFLENAIKGDIKREIDTYRFLPYIQLHEFEGLLFSDVKGFNAIDDIEKKELEEIEKIIKKNPNPELINDGDITSPSKRLLKIIKGYRKKIYGTIIAKEIGIETIKEKCPHFKEWIDKLIEMSKILE